MSTITSIDVLSGIVAAADATRARQDTAAKVVADIATGTGRWPGYLNEPARLRYLLESREAAQLWRDYMAAAGIAS